jgi:hypothetical protein
MNVPGKQKSDSSIFTDESLDEEMKGTDKLWYKNLDYRVKKDRKIQLKNIVQLDPNRSGTNNSAEQYKNMMSISSGEGKNSSAKYIPLSTVLNLNNDKGKLIEY